MNSIKERNFYKIIIFYISALLLVLLSTFSCSSSLQSPDNEADDIERIKTIIDDFGRVLANVPLLSPPDILEENISEYYSPFLSEELISRWNNNPSEALGRLTSSPWPDHIEIIQVKKVTENKYEVSGNVVEVTSAEEATPEEDYSNKYRVSLVVERINDRWLITEAVKETTRDNGETAEQPDIMRDFNDLLDTGAKSHEIVSFIDDNISRAAPESADFMLEKLEYIQRDDMQFYTDLLFEGDQQQKLNAVFNRDIDREDFNKIEDDRLKEIAAEIFNGGFRLIALEGAFYPYIDYEFLGKYSGYLTPQYQDYISIMARESENIYARDAALTISWDELALRLINCEEYLVSHPDVSVRKKEIGELYMKYLISYLTGQDNTPSYSYENNIIKPEVLESYQKIITGYPDYITSSLVEMYREIVTDNNNIIDSAVLKELDEIYRQALFSFNLDAPGLLLEGISNTYYQTSLTEDGYVLLVNGQHMEKNESNPEKDITIKLTGFTAFGDFDGDGINDTAAILSAESLNAPVTYSLTLNLNRYFYFRNIPDRIIGVSSEVKILGLEIKDNKIYLNLILNDTEESMIFGVRNEQFFEY